MGKLGEGQAYGDAPAAKIAAVDRHRRGEDWPHTGSDLKLVVSLNRQSRVADLMPSLRH